MEFETEFFEIESEDKPSMPKDGARKRTAKKSVNGDAVYLREDKHFEETMDDRHDDVHDEDKLEDKDDRNDSHVEGKHMHPCQCCCPPKPDIRIFKMASTRQVKVGACVYYRIFLQNKGCMPVKVKLVDKFGDHVEFEKDSLLLDGKKHEGCISKGIEVCLCPCEKVMVQFKVKVCKYPKDGCLENMAEARVEVPCYCTHRFTSNCVKIRVIKPLPPPVPKCCCCCCCCCNHHDHSSSHRPC